MKKHIFSVIYIAENNGSFLLILNNLCCIFFLL
ncbi:hypothetical protein CP8484711_1686A, partial [Chlamydia psittaci 84-8471/1]